MSDKIFLASYTVVDYGNKLKFLIPSNKLGKLILYSFLWLIVWSFLGYEGISTFFIGQKSEGAFLLVFITILIWIFFLIIPVYTLMWQLLGREITTVSNDSITVSRRIMGIGFTNTYEADKIANLHVDEVKSSPFILQSEDNVNFNEGCKAVVFYYGRKTVKIVSNIVEAEAWQILETIQTRFPTYKNEEISTIMSDR